MTYPIAEACFEDKDFLSFFASDEPMLAAEIVHNEGNFGYAAIVGDAAAIAINAAVIISVTA